MDWTLEELATAFLRHGLVSIAGVFIASVFLAWAARRKRDPKGPPRPK